MSEQMSPGEIVSKTPEQLKDQVGLVNQMRSTTHYNRPLDVPPEAIDQPQEFQRKIQELQKNSPPEKYSADAYLLESYNKYLAELRSIRKEQKEYTYLPARSENASPLTASEFVQHEAFNPYFATHVLRDIQKVTIDGVARTVLTPTEINRAAVTKNSYESTLNETLEHYPQLLYRAFDELRLSLPPQKIAALVAQAGSQPGVLKEYSRLLDIVPQETLQELARMQLTDPRNSRDILTLFKNKDIAATFPPELVHDSVVMSMAEKPDLEYYETVEFLRQGIITEPDIEPLIYARIKGLKPLKTRFIDDLLPENIDRQKIAEAIVSTYATGAKTDTFEALEGVTDFLSPEQKLQLVTQATTNNPHLLYQGDNVLSKFITEEDFTMLLQENLTHPPLELSGVEVYRVLTTKAAVPAEAKEQFMNLLVARGDTEKILSHIKEFKDSFIDPDQRRRVVQKIIANVEPVNGVHRLNEFAQEVSPEFIEELIIRARQTPDGLIACITAIEYWGPVIKAENTELIMQIITEAKKHTPASLLENIEEILPYIDQSQQESFVQDLIKVNPFNAMVAFEQNYFLQTNTFGISKQEIMRHAKENEELIAFAPKTIADLLKRYSPDKSVTEQRTLIMEGINTYQAIGQITESGLAEKYLTTASYESLPESKERELLHIFKCFSLLHQKRPEYFDTIDNFGNSPEESKDLLMEHFSKVFKLERDVTTDETQQFYDTMKTPVPFMTYALSYIDSPEHSGELREIFTNVLNGSFSEWKFGADTDEELENFKSKNLLPQSLTLEQYRVWRNDGSTSTYDNLSTTTESAAAGIQSYFESNFQHLEIEPLIDELYDQYEDELPAAMQQTLANVGQELARVNKEIGIVRQQPDSEALERLLGEKSLLVERKEAVQRLKKIYRVSLITADEVAAGFFMEGKEHKQKGEAITKTLAELRASSRPENSFVYENVSQMLFDFKHMSGEDQNLVSTDSSDPKVWIEIGQNPVASCQNYDNGSHNGSLLGYTDANTKILTLRNEKGNLIGRSIFRLLTTSDETPGLHLERIYSSSTSDSVKKNITLRALQVAEAMQVPLFVSKDSATEYSGGGFTTSKSETTLTSLGSRAPSVYVDSVEGIEPEGKYTIIDTLQVQRGTAN